MTDWKPERDALVDERLAFARTVPPRSTGHRFGGATKTRADELGWTPAGRNRTACLELQSPPAASNKRARRLRDRNFEKDEANFHLT
jgi:hypothetical protein